MYSDQPVSLNASFRLLNDGSWGIRVIGSIPTPGTVFRVQRQRDGRIVPVTVRSVVWSSSDARGDAVALCAIYQDAPTGQTNRRGGKRGTSRAPAPVVSASDDNGPPTVRDVTIPEGPPTVRDSRPWFLPVAAPATPLDGDLW